MPLEKMGDTKLLAALWVVAVASGDPQPVLHISNRCLKKASVTYPRVNTYSPFPTTRLEVAAMSTVGPIFCYDGRPVKVKLGEDASDPDCETWSNPFDCASAGSVVVIECDEDDART